jgi:hypothetical protein
MVDGKKIPFRRKLKSGLGIERKTIKNKLL